MLFPICLKGALVLCVPIDPLCFSPRKHGKERKHGKHGEGEGEGEGVGEGEGEGDGEGGGGGGG